MSAHDEVFAREGAGTGSGVPASIDDAAAAGGRGGDSPWPWHEAQKVIVAETTRTTEKLWTAFIMLPRCCESRRVLEKLSAAARVQSFR